MVHQTMNTSKANASKASSNNKVMKGRPRLCGRPVIIPACFILMACLVSCSAPRQTPPPPLPAGPSRQGQPAPEPPPPPRTVWRVQVDFWRPASRTPAILQAQARHVRKRAQADVSGDDLSAFARQPLRPVRPQQPLDIGLFEVRAPENPDRLLPDE